MPTGDPVCPRCGNVTCLSWVFGRGTCMGGGMDRDRTYGGDDRWQKRLQEAINKSNAIEPKDLTEEQLSQFLAVYMGDEVFARRFAACITMLRSKNADYSQGEQKGDRIAAFRRIARDIDIPMKKAWAVFCQKHWGAVMKFVKEGRVESEPLDGRINDIINYMVLLGAIIDDEAGAK